MHARDARALTSQLGRCPSYVSPKTVLRYRKCSVAIGRVSRETPPCHRRITIPSERHSEWRYLRVRSGKTTHGDSGSSPLRQPSRLAARRRHRRGEVEPGVTGVSRETDLRSKPLLRSGAPGGGPRCAASVLRYRADNRALSRPRPIRTLLRRRGRRSGHAVRQKTPPIVAGPLFSGASPTKSTQGYGGQRACTPPQSSATSTPSRRVGMGMPPMRRAAPIMGTPPLSRETSTRTLLRVDS